MRGRLVTTVGSMLLGCLLAGAYLVGQTRATSSPPAPTELLELNDYCHHEWGSAASGYLSSQPHRVRCTAVRNGVWGLEPVDLDEACQWQRGPGATFRLEEEEVVDSRSGAVGWEVLCVE